MRSEETMPLRRGGCGDDCMPTTSVNEKNEDGRRGRENKHVLRYVLLMC